MWADKTKIVHLHQRRGVPLNQWEWFVCMEILMAEFQKEVAERVRMNPKPDFEWGLLRPPTKASGEASGRGGTVRTRTMGTFLTCKLTLSVVAISSNCIIHRKWALSSCELVESEQRSSLVSRCNTKQECPGHDDRNSVKGSDMMADSQWIACLSRMPGLNEGWGAKSGSGASRRKEW